MNKCQYCEKEFKNAQGVSLHEKLHCKKRPSKEEQAQNFPKGCEHDWGFLNANIYAHAQAMNVGYSEVCALCGTLKR